MSALLEPLSYSYMVNAIWVSGLVGGVCGFLSAFLMLKGWSLIGDALSHAIVPGVAGAYMLGLPFAAGAFLVVLRPFKVGDFVSIGGVTGTVREIGLFATALDTPDNVRTVVGNGKVFADTIQNFSTNPYRRVDLQLQLVDPLVEGDHLFGQARVALGERADAAADDLLDLGAHEQELLAQAAQLLLVLAVGVLARRQCSHGILDSRSLTRSDR